MSILLLYKSRASSVPMSFDNAGSEPYARLTELGVSPRLLDQLSPASLEQLLTSVTALLKSHGRPSKLGYCVLHSESKP